MDRFSIIQEFFTHMQCNHCMSPLHPDGIQLIREEDGVFIVNVSCRHCDSQIGVAMVGMEQSQSPAGPMQRQMRGMPRRRYRDPELTPRERRRLSKFSAINENDVLEAHEFIENLGPDWLKHVPARLRERYTKPQNGTPQPEGLQKNPSTRKPSEE